MVASPGRTAVYRPFNAAGQLLYVGVAEIPEVRWKRHARVTSWWHEVDGLPQVEWFETRIEAEKAEKVAIRTESPLHNVVGTPRHGQSAIKPPVGSVYNGPIMGAAEIGARLDVSRQRIQQLVTQPDFPAPDATLAMGKVWTTKAVEAWIRAHRPDQGDGP